MIKIVNDNKEVDLALVEKTGVFLVTKGGKHNNYSPNTVLISRNKSMKKGRYTVVTGCDTSDGWDVFPDTGYFGVEVSVEDISVKLL